MKVIFNKIKFNQKDENLIFGPLPKFYFFLKFQVKPNLYFFILSVKMDFLVFYDKYN